MPKITIRVANAEKLETQFLPELASGGLFIRSDKFLPLGAEVDIDLYLPSATEALPLKGRVTKVVDDDDARARKATGMTLAVDATSEPTRSRLDALYAAYKIPVKRGGPASNGAHGHAIPLPSPSTPSNGAIALPSPSGGNLGAIALPAPEEDDLPSPKGAPPPAVAPAIPSIAPAIPSIAPAIPAAGRHTTGSVPVMKFEKAQPVSPGKPAHDPFADELDTSAVTNPYRSVPAVEESAPDLTPVKPLPFPFKQEATKPSEVPGFSSLGGQQKTATTTPPPPPPAAAASGMDGESTAQLEARIRELEAAEARARDQAKKATAEKEALEAKHAEATKRLNDEIAALQRRPAGGGKSPAPFALLGLLLGAGVMFAYFNFIAPPPTTGTPITTTTTTGGSNTVAAAGTADKANTGTGTGNTGSGTPTKVDDSAGKTDTALVAAVQDAGTRADDLAAKPPEVKDAGTGATDTAVAARGETRDAGTTLLAQADVGGTKTDVKIGEKTDANPEKVADKAPPVIEEKKVEEKKAPPAEEPIGENAGVLNLRADLPATVYVNGKRIGNAPALGIKANPGKVTVRFDCIVEDVRVRGRNRIVNLEPNGKANVNYSCIE